MKDPAIPATPLESVTKQFNQWRETRIKKGKIPDSLWALVRPLMGQYNRNQISSALKINYDQLKEHASPSSVVHQKGKSNTFVECTLPAPAASTGNCIIEFTCKNGSAVKITGLQYLEIQSVISVLMGG